MNPMTIKEVNPFMITNRGLFARANFDILLLYSKRGNGFQCNNHVKTENNVDIIGPGVKILISYSCDEQMELFMLLSRGRIHFLLERLMWVVTSCFVFLSFVLRQAFWVLLLSVRQKHTSTSACRSFLMSLFFNWSNGW